MSENYIHYNTIVGEDAHSRKFEKYVFLLTSTSLYKHLFLHRITFISHGNQVLEVENTDNLRRKKLQNIKSCFLV